MAKKGSIRGNADGENGENQSYTINGRGTITRPKLVKEVKEGKHEGQGTYKRDGIEYVRSLKDNSKGNNIDSI